MCPFYVLSVLHRRFSLLSLSPLSLSLSLSLSLLLYVCRLVEEVRDATEVDLETDDVYMNPTFEEFTRVMVLKNRGGDEAGFEYHPVS